MKTILNILAIICFTLLLTSCTNDDQPEEILSQTENPLWVRGDVYHSEYNYDNIADFQQNAMLLDLTLEDNPYWLSYYFAFSADYQYEPFLSYHTTSTIIEWSIYSQYYKRILYFTVTRIDSKTINIQLSDDEIIYETGNWYKD